MRRGRIEVEIALLHILAMISLVSRQSKKPFLQDGIALVPQRYSKTDHLPPITDARQPIFIPAIGARTGVIVRQVLPGIAMRAIVFADRAPSALAKIRPPSLPVLLARSGLR